MGIMRKINEIIIKVKTEGLEEAEEGIRRISDALDSFPGMIKIQKLENCEVNFHVSQFYSGGSEDEQEEEK